MSIFHICLRKIGFDEDMEDSQFLIFVLSLYPPAAAISFPPLLTASIADPVPGPDSLANQVSLWIGETCSGGLLPTIRAARGDSVDAEQP